MYTSSARQIYEKKATFITLSPSSKKNKEKQSPPSKPHNHASFNGKSKPLIKHISRNFIEVDEIDMYENDIFVRETMIDENDTDQDKLWRCEVDYFSLNHIRVRNAI